MKISGRDTERQSEISAGRCSTHRQLYRSIMCDPLYEPLAFKVLSLGVLRHQRNALLLCEQTYDFPFQVLSQARHGQSWPMVADILVSVSRPRKIGPPPVFHTLHVSAVCRLLPFLPILESNHLNAHHISNSETRSILRSVFLL